MKIIISTLAAVTLVSQIAFAKDEDFNDFHASRFAQLFERLKTTDDLYKTIPHTDKARELIKKDVEAKPRRTFDRLPIEMDGSTVVVFKMPKKDVRLEFDAFDEGHVTFNGKKIELTRAKTYINYKNELEAALMPKTSFYSLLVERAEAQPSPMDVSAALNPEAMKALGDLVTSGTSSLLYSMSQTSFTFREMKSSADVTLAANISRAFAQDLKAYAPNGYDPNTMVVDTEVGGYRSPSFSCANGRLTQLARVRPKTGGGFETAEEILTADGKGGWTYRSDRSAPAITLDRNFVVKTSSEGLAARNANFLNHVQNPWRYFPRLADRCCAQRGCHAKVMAAATPNIRQMERERGAPQPSQGGAAGQ